MATPITDAATQFVTLPEVKRHLNIADSDSTNDDEIDMIRAAAEEHVEALIGPVLHRAMTQVATPSRDGTFVLNTLPVLTVASVTASGSTLAGYVVDAAAGVLTGVTSCAATTVTYTAGRTSCPEAVRFATLLTAGALWRSQLGGSPSALPDGELTEYQAVAGGSAIPPPRARALLEPYMLLPGVA